MVSYDEDLGNDLASLEEQLGNFGARLARGYSIGRSLTGAIIGNNKNLRSLGAVILTFADSFNDAIKEQKNLTAVVGRTGRDYLSGNIRLMDSLNMHGISFKEASDVLGATFMAGLNKSDKTTLKLLGQFQLLGVDLRKTAAVLTLNRHVLGLSVKESEDLAKNLFTTSQQYKISTTAVIDAILALKDTLKGASVTYGSAVSEAIQLSMPHLMGMFGQEAGTEINRVISALLKGGPRQAELAAKLGIPLSDLQGARSSERVVSLVMRAVTRMEGLISPLRGQPGSEFSIDAMIRAFGNVPELALLGQRLSEMSVQDRQIAREKAFTDAVADVRRKTLAATFNDMKRTMTNILLPPLTFIAQILGVLNLVFEAFGTTLGTLLGRILNAIILAWTYKNLPGMMKRISTTLLAIKAGTAIKAAPASYLMAGGGFSGRAAGAGAAGAAAGAGRLAFLGGPVGLALISAFFVIPMILKAISSTEGDILDEQKKQTDLMQGEQERLQSRMVDKVSQAVHLLSVLNDTQLAAIEEQNPVLSQIAVATTTTANKPDPRADSLETALERRPGGLMWGDNRYSTGSNPVNP